VGKETEGTSNGAGHYRRFAHGCGTLTKVVGRPNVAVELNAAGVVDLLAVVAGLALVLVSASDAVSTLVTTRRRREAYERLRGLEVPLHPYERAWAEFRRLREAYLPGLLAATRLLLVPLEFRHQTARLDITRSG
jgi:hypothetical protein